MNGRWTRARLFRKALRHKRRVKTVVADSKDFSKAFRDETRWIGTESVMPYPKNQMKSKRVLLVDKRFRSRWCMEAEDTFGIVSASNTWRGKRLITCGSMLD